MNIAQRLRSTGRLTAGIIFGATVLLIAACQPIVDPAMLEEMPAAQEESAPAAEPAFEVEPAMATINTRSLRVRQGPGDAYELVAGVKQGETYPVLAMSSDGAWLQLGVDRAPEGDGWVSTEFVTLEGDITNIPTVEVAEMMDEEASAEADAPAETDASAEAVAEAEAEAETETEAEFDQEAAIAQATPPPAGQALIVTDLPLRVRSAPTAEEENKIGNVFDGEVYAVLEVSEDGEWVKIEVAELSEDGGWVSSEYVVLGE